MLRNEAGEMLEVEFLNAGPLFDRIINPYVENLRAIGIDARMNRVDGAQMSQRQRDADFDIITDHFPMGYEPGPSLRQYFGTIGADESLFNAAGLADPVIDELLEVVIRAETRDEMEIATRALDRVLRAYRIRVPQWFNASAWVAYYNHYRYPEVLPPYGIGFLDFWWVDPEAEQALARPRGPLTRDGRLYPQTAVAHDPDAVRDHGRELRADPVRAGRPRRTGVGAARGRGRRLCRDFRWRQRRRQRVRDRGQLSGRAGPAAAVPR
jgi:hypothetical protein